MIVQLLLACVAYAPIQRTCDGMHANLVAPCHRCYLLYLQVLVSEALA